MDHTSWLKPVWVFIIGAGLTTGLCGITYITVQQNYRTTLDDPQLQIAEDAAIALGNGAVPAEIVPHGTPLVDIAHSLSPWVAVYDQQGHILEATGQLNNMPPTLPVGVFDTTQWNKGTQHRFSWQPTPDVRQAVVLAQSPDKKYFVAPGRNMREVEQRIEHEGELVFLGWAVLMAALFVGIFGGTWLLRGHRE